MDYQNEPMAKRDNRDISEKIVEMLNHQEYSATEQKEILNNVKKFLIENYMSKKIESETHAKFQAENISVLESI